jgi:hypothetical protein
VGISGLGNSPSSAHIKFSHESGQIARAAFYAVDAQITQEHGAFTVRIQLGHHLHPRDLAGGEETAASIEVASDMITGVAKEFDISEAHISLSIRMENLREGTWH